MFRDDGFKPERAIVNIVLMSGGIGDLIAYLPAVSYMHNQYTWITYHTWCPDFLVEFAKNVLPQRAIVRGYSQMPTKYDRNRPTKTTEWDRITSPMKMHPTDYAFIKLCDELPPIENKNYLRVDTSKVEFTTPLPAKYVVICPTYAEKVKEFKAEVVNDITNHVISKGYTIVYLGSTSTKDAVNIKSNVIKASASLGVDYSKGLNLVDQTSLLQAAKIMEGAALVVTMDGGLLHVAGSTGVDIVAGFTFVDPATKSPIRANSVGYRVYPVTPPESLACRFCQSNTNFLYNVADYRKCLYKDFKCVESLTSKMFIDQIDKVLVG
jgi:ADP-heptose:LPS heptosyltransferase